MARVRSFLQLRGSIGETTFKQVGKKNYAQDKVVINKDKIRNDKQYTTLRKNGKQMGNASKSARAIRDSLYLVAGYCKDPTMSNRLNAELRNIVKQDSSDTIVKYGKIARSENMHLLQGFDFNDKVRLRSTFNVFYNTDVNRETGEVTVNIASFKPAWAIKSPHLATKYRIMAHVAEIDFNPAVLFMHKFQAIGGYFTDYLTIDTTPTEPLTIKFKIKPGNVNTIFIALGVHFNDLSNPLYENAALSKRVSSGGIVAVDEGVTVPLKGSSAKKIVAGSKDMKV